MWPVEALTPNRNQCCLSVRAMANMYASPVAGSYTGVPVTPTSGTRSWQVATPWLDELATTKAWPRWVFHWMAPVPASSP